MKLKVLIAQLAVRNRGVYSRGQTFEMPAQDAVAVIKAGYAEEVREEIQSREPEVEHRDPTPKKKGKKI